MMRKGKGKKGEGRKPSKLASRSAARGNLLKGESRLLLQAFPGKRKGKRGGEKAM